MTNISTMIKIMEYMALSKPIVQFEVKEGRRTAGDAALYADPTNLVPDFAQKILTLLDNPEQCNTMGEIGRQRVDNGLAWSFPSGICWRPITVLSPLYLRRPLMKSCQSISPSMSRLSRCLSVNLALFLVVLASRLILAQTFSASIAGTVSDSTGAVVRGAKLQLQNSDTKDIRFQISGEDGSYTFTNLLPGTYKLSVTARRFQRLRTDRHGAARQHLCHREHTVTQDHGEQAVINDTITPNSKWLVNLYGAYSHWFEGQTLLGFGKSASTIGLSPSFFQVNTLPLINAAGYYTLGDLYSTFDRYIRYNSTGIINVSRQFNVHTFKFGFNYDVGLINNCARTSPVSSTSARDSPPATPAPRSPIPAKPRCNPAPAATRSPACCLEPGGGGTPISMDPAFSQHSVGMYFQDEWRATSRLTVNLGLRYENQRPATERHNRIAYFDLNAVNPLSSAFGSTLKGALEYAGVNGRGRGAWMPDNTNFGPRLGLAYRVTDKLVARVGSGIFFGPASAMLSFEGGGQSPGYTAQTNWIATDNGGYPPLNLVSNPFPQGIQHPTGNQLGAMTYVGYGTGQLWPKIPHPIGTLYQWSMDFQYQITPQSVAEIGYTGVRGRHLLFGNPNLDLGQLQDHDLSLGSQLDQLVPNPYAAVIIDPNSYLSQAQLPYNELLRHFPEYTYLQQTRSLPGAWRDANNPKLDYSISAHDVPQSFGEAFPTSCPTAMAASLEPARPGQSTRSSVAGISPVWFACPAVCPSGSR